MSGSENNPKMRQSPIAFTLFCLLCLVFFALFTSLGIWQMQRLAWKKDLISRVETRLALAPMPAPPPEQWGQITAAQNREVLVTTVSDYGSGYWLLTPLQAEDGAVVFINRGFVPMQQRDASTRALGQIEGETVVHGLMRLSEGAGFFPRRNDGAQDRWYSRELPAMAAARGLDAVAPYFIDADKTANEGGIPIGGLTVVHFRNTHLSYAITWFVLALGVGAAFIFLLRSRGTSGQDPGKSSQKNGFVQ